MREYYLIFYTVLFHSYLLFLFSPHISPICLPDRFAKFTGSQCQAAGWGKNAFGDLGNFQNLLKEVSLPMVDHRLCQNALRQTRLGPNFSLHESMICAGGEAGSDTCEVGCGVESAVSVDE